MPSYDDSLGERLSQMGVSRRSFLKYCMALTSMLALPPQIASVMAQTLHKTKRPSVIWLSFQECTGCTESLTRSQAPTLESLILDSISLDYHHTLQAASGDAAEKAREEAMRDNHGKYLLVIDGSIPLKNPAYSTIAGISNLDMLTPMASGAAAIIAVGTCAAFGGIARAVPNPTGAVSVGEIIKDKPIVNIPGCPPIPVVIAGVVAHYLTFGKFPELDRLGRPRVFYGENIHDRCYRRPFYDRGLFADSFDDEGARKGWCLFKLGCKGPTTYNACATLKWNDGTSFPIESGHGCLGCSEPNFWDAGSFYKSLSTPIGDPTNTIGYAAAAGTAIGVAVGAMNRRKKAQASKAHKTINIDELEKSS